MATALNKPAAPASNEKPKKDPVPAGKRISDQLKRAAVTGKITKEELEKVATLENSLIAFIA
jgi:hypothetical protein